MAKELVLTQEERALIEKRRLREARKNKKTEELVAEAFKKLPTLSAFLRIAGASKLVEDTREIRLYLHGLFVNTSTGLIDCKNKYYSREVSTDSVPVYAIHYRNIHKICGQKLPFDCLLAVELANNKVIGFGIMPIDSKIFHSGVGRDLIRGTAYDSRHLYSYCAYEVSLYDLDKDNLKNKLITSIRRICTDIYHHCEGRITRFNELLQEAIQDRNEIKTMLGSYYKTFERKED